MFTQSTPTYEDVPSNYIWLQKDQQFSRHGRNSHIWSNELSLWPWTWRQQTNLLAWHFRPWCCITIPSLVTEDSAAEEISSRWTFTEILNLCDLDLDHNRAIQSFHRTIHLIMMNHQTKFSCKRISRSDNIVKSNILIILSLTVILTLDTPNHSFWKTIWLVMMHHHNKFGSKRFSNSENIIWTNIHWYFDILLWPWPWSQQSNFSIKHPGLW